MDANHRAEQAENYRKLAQEARAKAAAAIYEDIKRQWGEIARHYDMLAAFAEKKSKV